MTSHRIKKRGLLGIAVTLALAAAGGLFAASAPNVSAAADPPSGGAVPGGWVTLITGDRVLAGADLTIEPAPRPRPAVFREEVHDTDRYLIPGDVAGRVRSGELDRELFNVTSPGRQNTKRATERAAARPVGDLVDLTIKLVDRTGAPARPAAYGSVDIVNLDDSDLRFSAGGGTIQVPPGRYALNATIETPRPGREPSYGFISHPELMLGQDTTQTLDARIGRPASVSAADPRAGGGAYNVYTFTKVTDCSCTVGAFMDLDPRFAEVYAATVPGTRSETFAFGQARRAEEPALELATTGAGSFDVAVHWLPESSVTADRARLTAVYGGSGPADLARVDVAGKLVLIDVVDDLSYEELFARIAAVRSAGGRLVMINLKGSVSGDTESTPALPTMIGSGPTVQRLADLLETRPTPVDYASRPVPQLRYDLAYGVTGEVSTPQVHRPRTRDLAAVPTRYHGYPARSTAFVSARSEFFGSGLGTFYSGVGQVPQQRTEYFTPGAWRLSVTPTDEAARALRLSGTRPLVAGVNPVLAWNKAVSGPAFTGTILTRESGDRPWAMRGGDAIDAILPMFADSAARTRIASPGAGDTGSIALHRDGAPVGTVDVPDAARFVVPAHEAGYRLSARSVRNADWWPLSTEVSAEWTFRSSAADEGRALPLLTVGFDPELDLDNRAPGGGTFSFASSVQRQDGAAAITSYAVDVSYDDGRSWRPAAVTSRGDGWTVTVGHPAKGFASLRARAGDADGNTVEQSILRAYRIG